MGATAIKFISPREYLEAEVLADEKHEYFDGNIVAMAGAREAHNRIVANLLRDMGAFLKGKTCDVFPSDLRVATPSSNSYMYPDVSIVCGDIQKKDGEFDTCTNPSVIIEIMTDSTREKDQGYKFFYYQQIPSVKEYILIDSLSCYVQTIQKQQDGLWKFETIEHISASVAINTIGLTMPLADIYYRVLFAQPNN
jgi:Uma2 family endonuclease